MTDGLPDPGTFGAAFEEFVRAMTEAAALPASPLSERLREHLGAEPGGLPSTVAEFDTTEHPNLQLALDAVLGDAEILGFTAAHRASGRSVWLRSSPGSGMTGPISPRAGAGYGD